MKRTAAALLIIILLLSLAACGSARGQQETIDEAYQRGYNDGYDEGLWKGYEEARAEYNGKLFEIREQVSRVIVMIDEIELYEMDDIYDSLIKLEQFIDTCE